MAAYVFKEVDGEDYADLIRSLNALEPDRFPALEDRHLELGYWWLLKASAGVVVGFAGLCPFDPCPGVGYLKRAYVAPDHRGKGLQLKMIQAREEKARELGWHLLVSECKDNPHSERNFLAAGFEICEPEQPWGEAGSVYFVKLL